MRKRPGPLRADPLRHSINRGKEAAVFRFIGDYRRLAVRIGQMQWRQFFETGATNKYAPARYLNGICGAAPVQMASFQVQEQIDGWVSNRANEFVDRGRASPLPAATRHQLYTISRRRAWFSREQIKGTTPEMRALARSIMRNCMGRHRRPTLSRLSPRLDSRLALIGQPRKAKFADLWVTLRLPNRGRIALPVKASLRFTERSDDLCPIVQLCTQAGRVSIRLVQDMAKPFAAIRAAYQSRLESLGIDFGLATLVATSQATAFGRGPGPH